MPLFVMHQQFRATQHLNGQQPNETHELEMLFPAPRPSKPSVGASKITPPPPEPPAHGQYRQMYHAPPLGAQLRPQPNAQTTQQKHVRQQQKQHAPHYCQRQTHHNLLGRAITHVAMHTLHVWTNSARPRTKHIAVVFVHRAYTTLNPRNARCHNPPTNYRISRTLI